MQDLLGRLTALDPDASETLKVVSYFDALIARSVGVESMLRGAALITGATAGYNDGSEIIRVRSDGVRIDAAPVNPAWPTRSSGGETLAWIEREGAPHQNDDMVLERLSLALGIIRARRSGGSEGALELAISTHSTLEDRAGALNRLRLTGPVRVIASPPDPAPLAAHASAVVATKHGLTRATILAESDDATQAWGSETLPRLGVGPLSTAAGLADSWAAAQIAVRLTSGENPLIASDDLGAFLLIAEAAENAPMHADVATLAALDTASLDLLDAVVSAQSVRAAAVQLGRHHSSVQERVNTLTQRLGYDPRTAHGHTRYMTARMLLRLSAA